jgi:hypothetical protein
MGILLLLMDDADKGSKVNNNKAIKILITLFFFLLAGL